ncbi:MAG: hypothetical protein PHS41_05860 [Victivallaceae bacterium]|nr:hypothetical protein [Victivallaceae bacterium]
MLSVVKLMLIAVAVTAVTGFLISFLIQILTKLVSSRPQKSSDEEELTALAIAIALRGAERK